MNYAIYSPQLQSTMEQGRGRPLGNLGDIRPMEDAEECAGRQRLQKYPARMVGWLHRIRRTDHVRRFVLEPPAMPHTKYRRKPGTGNRASIRGIQDIGLDLNQHLAGTFPAAQDAEGLAYDTGAHIPARPDVDPHNGHFGNNIHRPVANRSGHKIGALVVWSPDRWSYSRQRTPI